MTTIDERRQEILAIARKFFPYPVPNPGQIECVVESVRHFLDGKKHVIIQAPTGIGKTAIAVTVHKVMQHYEESFRTCIMTATKGLQDQYVESDKAIYDLRGKSNYGCPHGKAPYNSGACRAHLSRGSCIKMRDCQYIQRRKHWMTNARLRLTNNSFQIEACPTICMGENGVDLIIADECDVVDDNIVDHTTIRFHQNDFSRLTRFGYGSLTVMIKDYINLFAVIPVGSPFIIDDVMYDKMSKLHEAVEGAIETFEEMMADQEREDHEEVGDLLEQLQSIGDKTEIFDCSELGGWIVSAWEPHTLVELKPVYAWQVSEYALFRKAKHFLHMSATICGFEEYAGTLGIKEGEYESLDIPNPIPIANRKVYCLSRMKVSGSFSPVELTGYIDNILKLHKNDNGIIHTVSYALANGVYLNSNQRDRMLVSKERYEIISELSKPKKGSVVLSAAFERGYDFKGDMSRFQIIAKVPYLYLGDPLVALNVQRRPKWYARKAILRIVQACGRSVRGVDDHAKTYILDSNFNRLLKDNMELFPEWFLDSLVI